MKMGRKRQNCWEYMKCGRQPGGEKAAALGVCPAACDRSFDGINRGKNAGRFCWAVAGTFCGETIQGSFAEKRQSCLSCGFFNRVRAEEGTANLRTKFLRFVSRDAGTPLLKDMVYRHVRAGQRFIVQGEAATAAYIIQRGSCLVIVEKEGRLIPVDHRGEGDIVGMMAILTGEPRSAHVEAETDVELWELKKSRFENISHNDPDLLNFFTELVAARFDSKRPITDRTIGRYVATDIIGRGAFSIVYKGRHLDRNLPVAIKMMRHDLALEPDFLSSFLNEAKIIATLEHVNIIKVFDIEKRFRTVFIIMEYLEGESLSDMLGRRKALPPALAVDFLLQIGSGLDYAHRQGIIHRDINPRNIIIGRDGRLRILDFGLACPIGTEDFSSLGTLAYMPPEQIEGQPMDQRTDIYALAVTAYEMVVGQRPFPEDDLPALIKTHLQRDIPDPAQKVAGLPPALGRFILAAGRCDPAQRLQKISQGLELLRPLVPPEGSHLKLSSES